MNNSYEKGFTDFLTKEKNITNMVNNRVKQYGKKLLLKDRADGNWKSWTWSETGEAIRNVSKGLLEFDVQEGDMVGLFSQNRAYWTIADLGILGIKAVNVPIYPTNSKEEAKYIIDEAGIKVIFVNDQAQYDRALSIMREGSTLQKIIVFDETVLIEGKDSIFFKNFLSLGQKSMKDAVVEERLSKTTKDDLATLIYTSGTTGNPKGAMLTHENFLFMSYACRFVMDNNEKDVALSFLPLSHVFERCAQYCYLAGGSEYHYCHDTKQILDFLKEVRPNWACVVPRIWEKVHAAVLEQVNAGPEKKKKIFAWAREVGEAYYWNKFKGLPIPVTIRFKHFFAYHIVLKKIQTLTGGRCRLFLNGGAPFNPGINRFFTSLGIPVSLGYGLTEIFPVGGPNVRNFKYGTSGPLLPLMQFRLSDEGEIQVKGPNLMKGYYKKPEATKEVFTEDGWFRTGDIGHLDNDGHIVITDRIKELIITSGGKNISPANIETLLKMNFYIEQAVAIGDGRKTITALIVPSFPALEEYARKNSITFSSKEELISNPAIIRHYEEIVEKQCESLGQVEKVKKFTLLPEELSQENGELTPTSKLKRRVINKKYTDVIDKMYS
ncbi:MAG TPA: long-chain fatty acid--CoA ligase [Spirochaetota bacterium]|nr:long-chain fatty acid--CoA ligase [Spirochaetota bacterium]HRX48966.1 long-chain fatty acid--CoA ligase [Spirochaetota bacterium]